MNNERAMRRHAPIDRPRRGPSVRARLGASRGFTLIELMIVVAVIGVLGLIALPSFMDSVRKSRRSDAIEAVTQIQQAQERWRANNPSYNNDLAGAKAAGGLGLSGTSAKGYYGLALSNVTAAGYTITATAMAGTSQAADTHCQKLVLSLVGGNLKYSSFNGGGAEDATDAKRCWNR
jgi:type IV pilus assembly protein PilE